MNRLGVLQAMTFSLIFDPENYDTKVKNILLIAKDWGIQKEMINFPEKVVLDRPKPGISIDEKGNFTGTIRIDGDLAGVKNVYEASHLINSMTAKEIYYANG